MESVCFADGTRTPIFDQFMTLPAGAGVSQYFNIDLSHFDATANMLVLTTTATDLTVSLANGFFGISKLMCFCF